MSQMNLEKACMDHVIKEKWLCIESVCFYHDISTTLNSLPLKDHTFKYIERNFVQVSKTSNFNEMRVQCVANLASSSHLQVEHKLEIGSAISRWVNHSKIERQKFSFWLLKHVRAYKLVIEKLQEDLAKGHSFYSYTMCKWIEDLIDEITQKDRDGKI